LGERGLLASNFHYATVIARRGDGASVVDFLQGILVVLLPSMLVVAWFVWRSKAN